MHQGLPAIRAHVKGQQEHPLQRQENSSVACEPLVGMVMLGITVSNGARAHPRMSVCNLKGLDCVMPVLCLLGLLLQAAHILRRLMWTISTTLCKALIRPGPQVSSLFNSSIKLEGIKTGQVLRIT